MASFPTMTVTNAGQAVLTKGLSGKTLSFTKIVLGDGQLNGQSISALTALISQKAVCNVTRKSITGGAYQVGGLLLPENITTGFYWREIGLIVIDPDTSAEVLYAYANAGTATDYIDPNTTDTRFEKNIYVNTKITSASNVTIEIPSSDTYAMAVHASQHAAGGNDPITTEAIGAAKVNHTHTAQDVGAAPAIHTHDDRYYTEAEVVALLAGKQDLSTAINTGNIGNQSVNYSNSAGAANTVGGYSAAQLIAAAATAGAKVEKISYVGTGTAGPSDPTVLAFTKLPKIVFLFDNYQTCILAKVKPNSYSDERWIVVSNCYYFNSTAHLGYGVGVTEDGTTLKISYGNSTYSYASQCQGNLQGTTYSAIGIS